MTIYKRVQLFCYSCAVVFLMVMLWRRSALPLSEVESFITLVLVFCGTLLLVCVGTLSGLAGIMEERRVTQRSK